MEFAGSKYCRHSNLCRRRDPAWAGLCLSVRMSGTYAESYTGSSAGGSLLFLRKLSSFDDSFITQRSARFSFPLLLSQYRQTPIKMLNTIMTATPPMA